MDGKEVTSKALRLKFSPELTQTNQMDMLEMLAPVGTSPELMTHLRDVNSMSLAIANNPELVAIEAILSTYYKKHELETSRICFTKTDKSIVVFPPTEFPADFDSAYCKTC